MFVLSLVHLQMMKLLVYVVAVAAMMWQIAETQDTSTSQVTELGDN